MNAAMRRFLIITLLALAGQIFLARDMTVRYWFDDSTVPEEVPVTADAAKSLVLDCAPLKQGVHALNISIIDSTGNSMALGTALFNHTSVAGCTTDFYVDGAFAQSVATAAEATNVSLEAVNLSAGLHSVVAVLRAPTGEPMAYRTAIFARVPGAVDYEGMRPYFIIDGKKVENAAVSADGAHLSAMIDATALSEGLHRISFCVADSRFGASEISSAYFLRAALGGDGIVAAKYWINDDMAKAIDIPAGESGVITEVAGLFPVAPYPFKSSAYKFAVTPQPGVYACHDANFFLQTAGGTFSLLSREYADMSTFAPVDSFTVLEKMTDNIAMEIGENELRWHKVTMKTGDSLIVNVASAATVDIFNPRAEKVYSASGADALEPGGVSAWSDGDYYISVHDTHSRGNRNTLQYTHLDKFALLKHTPDHSANVGVLNVDLTGNGMGQLKRVALVGASGELKADELYSWNRAMATAHFEIYRAKPAPGKYDLVLDFEDETTGEVVTVKRDAAFEIQPKEYSPIYTQLHYNAIRDGVSPHKMRVEIRNEGNVGGGPVPLNIAITSPNVKHVELLNFNMASFSGRKDVPVGAYFNDLFGSGKAGWFMPLQYPYIGPDETVTLEFGIDLGDSWGEDWGFYAWCGNQYPEDLLALGKRKMGVSLPPAINSSDNECDFGNIQQARDFLGMLDELNDLIDDLDLDIDKKLVGQIQMASRATNIALGIGEAIAGVVQGLSAQNAHALVDAGYVPMGHSIDEYTFKYRYQVRSPYDIMAEYLPMISGDDLAKLMGEYAKRNCPGPNGWDELWHIPLSWDPNEITGFTNISGSLHLGLADRELEYCIEFENDSTMATIDARQVHISTDLDPEVFDYDSFRPIAVKFGNYSLDLEGCEGEFFKTVDMRPHVNAIAEVSHKFNRETSKSEWTIRALHPMTLEPLVDKPYGVLPVNDSNGSGCGHVIYRIGLKDNVAHGKEVPSEALITFDSNDPVATGKWVNTTDYVRPVSAVTSIEAVDDSSIRISWNGSDDGSGLWKYDLYCQEGPEGPWRKLVEGTEATEHRMEVNPGSDYGFMVMATDLANNEERKDLHREMSYCDGKVISGTGLVTVPGDKAPQREYDLLGRPRAKGASGIYIRGGKTILIK